MKLSQYLNIHCIYFETIKGYETYEGGLRCRLVAEHLISMHKALDLLEALKDKRTPCNIKD